MKRKFYSLFLLMLVLAFAACTKGNYNAPDIVDSDKLYSVEAKSFTLPNEACGVHFCMDDKNFIYDMINEKTGERGAVGIVNTESMIPLTLFLTQEMLMAYNLDNGFVNICTYNEESYLVVKMNANTYEVIKDQEFERSLFGKEYPLRMCETKDNKYVFVVPSAVVVVDEESVEAKSIKCKEKEFIDALALDDGNIATISKSENAKTCLEIYSTSGEALGNKIVLDFDIEYFCEAEGKILLTDGDRVLSFDRNTGKVEELLSLCEKGLSRERVRGISFSDEKITVLSASVDEGNKRGQLSFFSLGEGKEIATKQTIKLYSLWGEADPSIIFPTLIEDFKLDNPQYDVEIIKQTGYVDDLYLIDNHPDILVEMFSSNVDKYASAGYLEDLWPYIDSSETLSREDLAEENIEVFKEDGKLYALPLYMTTSGIQIRSSQDECNGSWTVEEYLGWLEKHPEVRSGLLINRERVLEQCLKASIPDYVDINKGEAFFDTPEFCKILERISRLEFGKEEGFSVYENLAECKDVTYLFDGLNSNMEVMAFNEACFGEEFSYLGFPNKEGGAYIKDCSTNMGIFSTSENKEAAYKFLEYWLTYDLEKVEKKEVTQGFFWTYKRTQEADMQKVFSEHEMNGLSFFVSDKNYEVLKGAIDTARKQTAIELEIMDIIKEEFDNMVSNGKSPENTAKVIQSRAYILINERK